MNNYIFVLALCVSVSFFLFKFLEMRFILKQNKQLKSFFRDSLLVYFSVLIGSFILEQVGTFKNFKTPVSVFTDTPNF